MSEFVDESLREVTGDLDGPPCHVCGAIMVLSRVNGGTLPFWYCHSCGEQAKFNG